MLGASDTAKCLKRKACVACDACVASVGGFCALVSEGGATTPDWIGAPLSNFSFEKKATQASQASQAFLIKHLAVSDAQRIRHKRHS